MIHDEICTYEVCKLAKEKGFNVPTDRYYHIYDDAIEAQNSLEMTSDGCADFYNSLNQCRCAAPTQSLLQRWLREEKGIYIAMFPNMANSFASDYIVYTKGDKFWNPVYTAHSEFDTYELALEDALAYSLKNLI